MIADEAVKYLVEAGLVYEEKSRNMTRRPHIAVKGDVVVGKERGDLAPDGQEPPQC